MKIHSSRPSRKKMAPDDDDNYERVVLSYFICLIGPTCFVMQYYELYVVSCYLFLCCIVLSVICYIMLFVMPNVICCVCLQAISYLLYVGGAGYLPVTSSDQLGEYTSESLQALCNYCRSHFYLVKTFST